MLNQANSVYEILEIAQQKRMSQAAISTRKIAANANSVAPAHIRAALIYATRKAG